MVEDVVGNYTEKNIPLETIWLDIPYMDAFADFSVNTTAFPNIKAYTDNVLHKYH
jgi:alpha-glucosidase (family GH31 glycosyl hydrolase)